MQDKRLIEETFPVKEVSFHSAKEKSIRHGHISTLHIWWARRPLAASRATAYAALIPAPATEKELEEEKKFIAEFSKWENTNNPKFIEKARKKILKANNGKPPRVLDPFGGGGSIPLECIRLGCETYSNDLNPVAVLIQKCTLEFPKMYGNLISRKQYLSDRPWFKSNSSNNAFHLEENVNPLFEDVKFWGNWILEETRKELSQYYPLDPDGSIPVAYIWAKTIPCQNPSCSAEIPLLRQFWLARTTRKKIALYPIIKNKIISFKILSDFKNLPKDFDPTQGTVARAVVNCPVCNSSIDALTTRKLFKKGKSSQRLIAVITQHPTRSGKTYRIATANDEKVYLSAEKYLSIKKNQFLSKWGFNPVPDEELPLMSGVFNVPIYGIDSWGKLFNSRQLLSLITLLENIKTCNKKFISQYQNSFSTSFITYLALCLDRFASYNTSNAPWHVTRETTTQLFGRQAIPMAWDYAESNPISVSFSWSVQLEWILRVIENVSPSICTNHSPIQIQQKNVVQLDFQPNSFDAIFTDPPYYNSVPYADLSDFFYVWLKRVLGDVYPDLFITPLTPKREEITEMAGWDPERYKEKDKSFFEENLLKALQKIYYLLKPNGVSIIVYAHKTTEGWETLINSLIDSNLLVTGAWPIDTEMETRLRAKESAALASSIYIVCRKINKLSTALYNDVKLELSKYLQIRLDQLWLEGITGVDFYIAAIGASIEVFAKYEKVIDFAGKQIRADRLLLDVRVLVTDYAVRKILHNGFAGEISDLSRFYVLFRWEFGTSKIEFDEANKLAHSCHIDLADEWTKKSSFIKKDKEFISILGPQDRDIENLEESSELIDVLHLSLKYWEKNRKAELNTLLRVSGFGKSDAFFRVAQAIAETLPQDNKEKKLLEGFLNLREKIISTVSESKIKYDQGKLEFPENE